MPFHIRDPKTDALARELAQERNVGLTEAVNLALRNELRRGRPPKLMLARIQEIQDELARIPDTGLKADKAFFDELSGDED